MRVINVQFEVQQWCSKKSARSACDDSELMLHLRKKIARFERFDTLDPPRQSLECIRAIVNVL